MFFHDDDPLGLEYVAILYGNKRFFTISWLCRLLHSLCLICELDYLDVVKVEEKNFS